LIGLKIFGQLLIDAGFPFSASCITKFTAQWFPYQERFYATSACILFSMLGFGLGESSLLIFDNNNPLVFAFILTVLFVLSMLGLFFFKERP
jgi:hypothetical protein